MVKSPLEITTVISELMGAGVTSTERMSGGRNNQVYRVNLESGDCYVAKFYAGINGAVHDRLESEFTGLKFMWSNGIRCVPEPIAVDRVGRCAIYQYIDGERVRPSEITPGDIDQAVGFLAGLRELRRAGGANNLPLAADASLSFRDACVGIEARLARLQAQQCSTPEYLALQGFLHTEFAPHLKATVQRVCATLKDMGLPFDRKVGPEARTLSPSDFGFHNSIRRFDGQIIFFDFEYFGWDDPAKMISDFLLHPGNNVPSDMKLHFLTAMVAGFPEDFQLGHRVDALYPLVGLKWCLILLNEFVPELLQRRDFAGREEADTEALRLGQLSLAREMLRRLTANPCRVPYHD